jgi:hypothetical protein
MTDHQSNLALDLYGWNPGVDFTAAAAAARFLEDANSTTDDDLKSNYTSPNASTGNDGEVLKDTFVVYGSLLLVLLLLFCFVRRAFPRAYQLRNWVPHIKVKSWRYLVDTTSLRGNDECIGTNNIMAFFTDSYS